MNSFFSFFEDKMKKCKREWSIEAVLETDLESDRLPLVKAFIASIEDKKHISKVVQILASKLPLPKDLLFLKRVKVTDKNSPAFVIISVNEEPPKDLELPSNIQDFLSAELPSRPPRTRQQFEFAKKYWPCHFHEDKRIEAIVNKTLPEIWGEKFFDLHCQNIGEVLKGQTATGMVFDPKSDRVVATASESEDKTETLRHCCMNLIDCVAHTHGGGVWPLKAKVEPDCNQEAYLLTGYDVYLSHEPCIMCSMALVHSRAGRVFFSQVSSLYGGLYSKARLQTIKSLNHTFEVYKVSCV